MPTILPSPNFAWNPVTNPPKAGIRPKRDVTYRLEPEPHDGRLIVHNYGHAGAGITMSWGCAYEVAKIIADSGHVAGERVAVLGGGVMGLTAAVVLSEQHFDVTVYAKAFPPDTTSNVAGGQWAPASVQHNNKTQFERILKKAFDTHLAKGTAYGVSPKLNYATQELPSFQDVPHNIIMPPNTVVAVPTKLPHLPFAKLNSKGVVYSTLLVEPPIFLPKLISDLENAHVQRIPKTLGLMSQVLQDPDITQKIIVNCTGLGSKDICGDKKLHGVKGQLAMLPAQPALDYLFCAPGYLFPRKDAVVVGGTEEPEGTYTDDKPDIAECKKILAKVRAAFEPTMVDMLMPNFLAAKLGPKYFIQGK